MPKYLLRNLLVAIFLTACSTASHNTGENQAAQHYSANGNRSAAPAFLVADSGGVDQSDSLTHGKPLSLMDLPQSEDGEIILSEGFYEGEFKSYCLQPGTPAPSDRDAYRQGSLGGYRSDIIETILRNSLNKPDLDQRNIQLLLWSVVSGSDFRKLSWETQATAGELLSRKQIFELKGGVMGIVRTVSESMPETRTTSALNDMKHFFELGESSYELFERMAVLQQSAPNRPPAVEKDHWYKQDAGYWLRYFPSGYQKIKIQVYVAKGSLDSSGKKAGNWMLFDPVTMMAIPVNSNSQRLGIGAPAVDVIRKIIQIQKLPAPVKKPPPPVKVKNPKGF
jgi:hypothetical protein